MLDAHPSTLEDWQFYGPTTADGSHTYLLCLQQPHGEIVLRGVYGRRIESVRTLGTRTALDTHLRLSALDRLVDAEPICDVVITVPPEAVDDLVTVIEVTHHTPLR